MKKETLIEGSVWPWPKRKMELPPLEKYLQAKENLNRAQREHDDAWNVYVDRVHDDMKLEMLPASVVGFKEHKEDIFDEAQDLTFYVTFATPDRTQLARYISSPTFRFISINGTEYRLNGSQIENCTGGSAYDFYSMIRDDIERVDECCQHLTRDAAIARAHILLGMRQVWKK